MTLMGLVKNLTGLLIARVFLGMMEAGYFPGVAFYLTNFYKRDELAFRIAIFFSMATFAGAFGGILAYGIGHMKGVGGFENGWHWIFILGIVIPLPESHIRGNSYSRCQSYCTFLYPRRIPSIFHG
jgi:MFS family permease